MFNQLCRAIDPSLSMAEVLADWAAIATGLAEPTTQATDGAILAQTIRAHLGLKTS